MEPNGLNETKLEQMPSSMQGEQQNKKPHTAKSLLIALLIILVAAGLGYWYLKKNPAEVINNEYDMQNVGATQSDNASELDQTEQELNELYFEGVVEGL